MGFFQDETFFCLIFQNIQMTEKKIILFKFPTMDKQLQFNPK